MIDNSASYSDTTARLAILKAKAAYFCASHPEVLILSGDQNAQMRAYAIAQNTVKYHDKMFLLEQVSSSVKKELDKAVNACSKCAHNAAK